MLPVFWVYGGPGRRFPGDSVENFGLNPFYDGFHLVQDPFLNLPDREYSVAYLARFLQDF